MAERQFIKNQVSSKLFINFRIALEKVKLCCDKSHAQSHGADLRVPRKVEGRWMRCLKCGSEMKENQAFCGFCGNSLVQKTQGETVVFFIDSLLENERKTAEHISDFKEVLKNYEEGGRCNIFKIIRQAKLRKRILECIECFEDISRALAGLRYNACLLTDTGDSAFASRNRYEKQRDAEDCLTHISKGFTETATGKSLVSKLKKLLKKSDEDAARCADAAAVLLSGIETVYRNFSEYLHKTKQEIAKEPPMPVQSCCCASAPCADAAEEECYSIVSDSGDTGAPDINSIEMCDVQFSAVVQKKAALSEYLSVDIIMYEEDYRRFVDERLDETVKEIKSGYHNVAKESKIKVVLSSKDIDIDDCEEEGIWQGKYLELGFAVEVPEQYSKKQILLCASVYVNDLIATKLKLIVDVQKEEAQKVGVERDDVMSAFVSYASEDRDRVAAIVQGMKKARPDLDVFFDVESLRSGQKWKEVLGNEIDKSSVLFLCWSRFAKESEWVEFEWRYALEKKGEDFIDPIPIDPPELCPPPAELQQKHFNDRMIYVIKALEYMNKEKAYLILTETGEKIYINKNGFMLGRAKDKVDYVTENRRVGRIHAEITSENNAYYITDFNSVNKTYVDGVECAAEERVPLSDGAVIMLADMEMIFKLPESRQ